MKYNCRNKIEGRELLATIASNSVRTSFFDPQYRGVLDKMNYGNEGKSRGASRCELAQMSEDVIIEFINEIHRVLMPSGHLFLWVDKFHLCQGVVGWLSDTQFEIVDMIVWDKMRMGMGYRSRRKCEYLIVLQKKPTRAKGCWVDHGIPDVWPERVVKEHPHSKPIELQRRLIMATTNEGELVLDPCAGGYSVLKACQLINRNFIGGDIEFGE